MSVKRYTHVFVKASGSREMFEDSEEGEWVGYEDYVALKVESDARAKDVYQLEERIKELERNLRQCEQYGAYFASKLFTAETETIPNLKATVERYEKALKMAGLDDIFISEALKK